MAGNDVVRVRREGDIALVLIDNPPVNATSQAVRQGLDDALAAVNADPSVKAIVIACEGTTFVAGADIKEFGKPPLPPFNTELYMRVEASSKPVVAAIHGTALGGGFELTLACHARVMDAKAAVGLPEVKIGVMPGAGGTQRLPRLAGMMAALDIATSGRRVPAAEALTLGIVDEVVSEDLRGTAIRRAQALIGQAIRRTGDLPVPSFDRVAFDTAVAAVKKKGRGQISIGRAADAVAMAATVPFAEAVTRERDGFMELVASDQAKAMRHAFFAEREVLRVPHLKGVAPRPIASAGVIGAGTMGSGIAIALIESGLPVTVVETSEAAREAGAKRITSVFDRHYKAGRIDAAEHKARCDRLTTSLDYKDFAACDLVVEAAFEEMGVKRDIFGRLAPIAKQGAILATNTSYLDVNEIAQASGRPADVVGLHFFSPANIMRLVEVVEGEASDKAAVAAGVALAQRLKKIPVVCGVCDGFVGNRILATWRAVPEFALEDGALPQEIDAALEAYGFSMGPFAVSDLAGLDIGWARRKRIAPTRNPNTRYPSTIADRLCEQGRFGQKTGAGWFKYVDGKKQVDPDVTALVERVAAEKGIERKPIAPETIQRRVLAAMANEGAKILAEGVVPRALDIDIVLLHGYGFPVWRGGPMFAADEFGLDKLLPDVEALYDSAGPGFEPAPLLVELAKAQRRFGDLQPGEAYRA